MAKFTFKKPSRRDVLVSAACLTVGLAIMGGAVWYKDNKAAATAAKLPSLTEKNVASAIPVTVPKKNDPYSLKKQESPFASLTPQKPVAALPPMPVMPSVPVNLSAGSQRGSVDSATGRKGLHVTSVFVGNSGKNMAVLSDGKTQVTARVGKECKFGYVDEITKEGVSVGGRWIAVSKEAMEPSDSVVVAAAVPMPPSPVAAPVESIAPVPAAPPAANPAPSKTESKK